MRPRLKAAENVIRPFCEGNQPQGHHGGLAQAGRDIDSFGQIRAHQLVKKPRLPEKRGRRYADTYRGADGPIHLVEVEFSKDARNVAALEVESGWTYLPREASRPPHIRGSCAPRSARSCHNADVDRRGVSATYRDDGRANALSSSRSVIFARQHFVRNLSDFTHALPQQVDLEWCQHPGSGRGTEPPIE